MITTWQRHQLVGWGMPLVSLLKCCFHNNHCNDTNASNKFQSLREFTSMIQKLSTIYFSCSPFYEQLQLYYFSTQFPRLSVCLCHSIPCSSVIESHGSRQLMWLGIQSILHWPNLSSHSYTCQSMYTHTLVWGDRLFPYWAEKHWWI